VPQVPQVPQGVPRVVPPATGQRLDWADAPGWLRDEVEERLGESVVEAVTQPGGFSPGLAVRLGLADGRRAFVKAVGPDPNPDSAAIHRSEARTMAALPRSAPAPRLLWSLDATAGSPWPSRTSAAYIPPSPGGPGSSGGSWTWWPTWPRP
jgi:hypothetical protein